MKSIKSILNLALVRFVMIIFDLLYIKEYNFAMSNEINTLYNLKDTIQDANLNFLMGSGLSGPFLSTLGNIEDLLSEIDKQIKIDEGRRNIIRSALYRRYCDEVIFKNIKILEDDPASMDVLDNYKVFIETINSILRNRYSPILNKQVNIFTTNIDIYLDKAFEGLGVELNDGFNGRFTPTFNLSNFRKSTLKRSSHYENTSEIPVFNLLKLHGSLTWKVVEVKGEKKVKFSPDLMLVKELEKQKFNEIAVADASDTLVTLLAKNSTKRFSRSIEDFLEAYHKLPIINPTKDKFKLTLLNQNHYELLRIYANELEKENSVLFVMGFSFSDEHIREITLRAINSNPTLTVYIFAHSATSEAKYESLLGLRDIKNRNVKIIVPNQKDFEQGGGDIFCYDFKNINEKVFKSLLRQIEENEKN
ncbi:MAG: SIR2 family protein [Candidatus Paceibacterota bacterium]